MDDNENFGFSNFFIDLENNELVDRNQEQRIAKQMLAETKKSL